VIAGENSLTVSWEVLHFFLGLLIHLLLSFPSHNLLLDISLVDGGRVQREAPLLRLEILPLFGSGLVMFTEASVVEFARHQGLRVLRIWLGSHARQPGLLLAFGHITAGLIVLFVFFLDLLHLIPVDRFGVAWENVALSGGPRLP